MSEKITTVEALGALPVGSVWRTAGGLLGETIRPTNRGRDVARVRIDGVAHLTQIIGGSDFPVTVLYRPDDSTGSTVMQAASWADVTDMVRWLRQGFRQHPDSYLEGKVNEIDRRLSAQRLATLGITVTDISTEWKSYE